MEGWVEGGGESGRKIEEGMRGRRRRRRRGKGWRDEQMRRRTGGWMKRTQMCECGLRLRI